MNIAKKLLVALAVCCFFIGAAYPVSAVDENVTIEDNKDDVLSFNIYGEDLDFTDEKPNIDIKNATYQHNDGVKQVTLTLEVYGLIEDRGNIDFDETDLEDITSGFSRVSYGFLITTSGGVYEIEYVNQECRVVYPDETEENITSFSVNDETLQINFNLINADETYSEMIANTQDVTLDLTSEEVNWYLDIAPDEYQLIVDAGGPYEAEVDESISFQGEAEHLIPTPSENFEFDWDFGDGTTSSQQNPNHSYDEAGTYTATLTVTDEAGSVANDTAEVTITGSSSGNGQSNGESNTGLLLFIAIIAIIVIIGIVVLVLIIRR
ncbi:MAG: PKD domain-containing protein [Candidatus Thermoplasmatota archaeon]|nr:PKD domain-containing protein [Candidatus Thermoplasmatota archaeon]